MNINKKRERSLKSVGADGGTQIIKITFDARPYGIQNI